MTPEAINEMRCRYWERRFWHDGGGTETQPFNAMNDKIMAQIKSELTMHQAAKLERPVSSDETLKIVLALTNRKTAGQDSLRAELFSKFENMGRNSGKCHECYPEFRINFTHGLTSSIIVLLKRNGSLDKVENYRPMALVRVLTKFVSGVYCNRVNRVLSHIISDTQTGFIPGKQSQKAPSWHKMSCTGAENDFFPIYFWA